MAWRRASFWTALNGSISTPLIDPDVQICRVAQPLLAFTHGR
jgi:hypothetical protein